LTPALPDIPHQDRPRPQFVPVELEFAPRPGDFILECSSGCALRIPGAFDPDQLRRLLDVLGCAHDGVVSHDRDLHRHRPGRPAQAFDGLAALVRQSLGHDPLSGSVYVFGNKRKDRIKILFWELGGYWLCMRRLEQGTFCWPPSDAPCARYSREELGCYWVGSI
jgi:hypothetical protein